MPHASRALVRFIPVFTYANLNPQRHIQRHAALHQLTNFCRRRLNRVGTDFKHQFIVYLHNHGDV